VFKILPFSAPAPQQQCHALACHHDFVPVGRNVTGLLSYFFLTLHRYFEITRLKFWSHHCHNYHQRVRPQKEIIVKQRFGPITHLNRDGDHSANFFLVLDGTRKHHRMFLDNSFHGVMICPNWPIITFSGRAASLRNSADSPL